MKTMLFVRHGKSNWDADYGGDHERPLAQRGVRAAREIGRALERAECVPDFVLSSTAVRARSTAELVMEAAGRPVQTRHDRGLYEGGVSRVLDLVRQVPDVAAGRAVDTLLVAGHQPTWSDTVSQLIGGGNLRFVTAAAACVRCEVNRWADVKRGACELLWFLPPKLLAKIC